jgi:hypothetical protein
MASSTCVKVLRCAAAATRLRKGSLPVIQPGSSEYRINVTDEPASDMTRACSSLTWQCVQAPYGCS